ncbi:FtsK/SpoIIIE domain-containing protein [Parageobacillus toebii]|uniref:FtsK/SpoIIIE domain-containing protein n=1 Tax=Parageobacillus toebii TaxID=153151 RepID=UPI001967BDD2|nr:FtsK/SpoIIIE domain-containing protein [Parageobacillus toebii]QSB47414.1 DNA translocase FtsK [Parageobacillus toebii]
MITSEQFLAKWVNSILLEHFKKQKNSAKKLFIKLSGLTEHDIRFVLEEINNSIELFKKHYEPIIRTITPISGFEYYKFRDYETSTWLRNNIKDNQALILIINKMTPEAQSLENLFSIDESYLLSEKGLNVLYELLVHEFRFASDEIKELKMFLEMIGEVAAPQLRTLLQFIVLITNENMPAIAHRIRKHLPSLGLFRDSKLKINKSHIKRLKDNYMLANLQKGTSLLDGEKLLEKLDSFLDHEEKHNWISELWDSVQPDIFRQEAVEFIQKNNKSFLKYEYEIIEQIFNFKIKQSLSEKVSEAINLSDKSEEEKKEIELGIEAIRREENPDEIQDFLEKYGGEISSPSIIKAINRLIERLRHPAEYEDIYKAILYEGFSLIDEHFENEDLTGAHFRLRIVTSKVNEKSQKLLNIYLKNFSNLVPIVEFNEQSIPIEYDESSKDKDITFELELVKDDVLGKSKFKILDFENNEAYSLIEEINHDLLPYIKNYSQQEVDKINVKDLVNDNVKYYLTSQTEGMDSHFKQFNLFIDEYLTLLKNACENGLCSINPDILDNMLSSLLSNIYSSVNITKFIYKSLNYIGVIDSFNTGTRGEIVAPTERIVTVFNPIRLLSYLRRMESINVQLTEWMQRANKKDLTVYKIEDYLTFITDKYSRLAPRYFVNEDEETYLLENKEKFGNGVFVVNTHPTSSSDYLSRELSSELVNVVKNYLEVYPYAKDGLDLLFLYCQSADVVIRSVDELFKRIPRLSKLKLTVHSTQAAQLHKELNSWIELREEYRNSAVNKIFPKVEISVINGKDINEISSQISSQMFDTDLVVLMDYFGQNGQVKYNFSKVDPVDSKNWFNEPYKEPLSVQEARKHIPYVSESLPKTLQHFYQMQYIIHSNSMPSEKELHLLNVTISANHFSDGALIDFMHEHFNWVMIMDRFLDKSLLQKTSSKAQIIQYKSKAGKNKNFKLILSSSKYIRKLSNQNQDYAYYDRLHRKLCDILKNDRIQRDIIIKAVDKVKDISGSLVLRVIGPGKYAHEMLATYLTMERRSYTNREEASLTVWSVCDELPWFSSNKRRPDLVYTVMYKRDGKIVIDFELIELKFVNHYILDRERIDAIKQVDVGLNEYRQRFSFSDNHADAEYWKSELVHYLVEKQAYLPLEVELLKELQHTSAENIEVNFSASIDVYCYTANLTNLSLQEVEEGVYLDTLGENYNNYVYGRHYILKQLGADEEQVPSYDEFIEDKMDEEGVSGDSRLSGELENNDNDDKEKNDTNQISASESDEEEKDNRNSSDNRDDKRDQDTEKNENDSEGDEQVNNDYPEVIALEGVTLSYENKIQDYTGILTELERRLVRNFLKNGLDIKIKESIVGSSVIRFYLDVPSDITTKKIMSRSQDIQVWLGLSNEPNFSIDKNGMYMDIVREKPDTIYFENFMKLVRKQLSEKINDTNLIAPLGLDPLNNVVSIDLSDSTTPHLLVGGTTGSGKSVTLNSIILSVMCLYSPEDVQFVFIDPKQVEFNFYAGKSHTRKVITQIEEAVQALEELVEEMDQRYTMMNKEYVSNLEEFVKITGNKLPRIVIVFDEFADFMNQDKEIAKRVETAIQRLGQKARAAGIHLIICTQYPKAEIINTKIRANLPGRLALKAADAVASHVILDQEGAERLAGKGDFLAKINDSVIRGKSPFLTPEVKRALLKYFEQKM